jgi:hypothetical protein
VSEETTFAGGCLCGQVRFEGSKPIDAGYCHCRLCQRSSGAPLLAWVSFPTTRFSFSKAEPASYPSSATGRRDFCAHCGTSLAFRDSATPERVDVYVGSLDDPASIEPEYHIWIGSRMPWLHIQDDLPRYTDNGPDSPSS